MKSTLILNNPIQIDGNAVKALTYDPEEVTCELFAQAESQKLRATGGAARNAIPGALELDYTFHVCLGHAAIIAVNPDIDFEDLKRIKGSDVRKIMTIGRNFTKPGSEEPSAENDSGEQSEITPEPSTLPPETSNNDD